MDSATIPAPEVDQAITLSRQQAAFEERSASSPQFTSSSYNNQWALWGPKVDEVLLSYAPVFQAVGLISGDVAKLPLDIYRRLGPKTRELDMDHHAYRTVRISPETGYNAVKWWRRFMVQLLIYSNGYARIHRNNFGEVDSLELLESSRMTYQRNASTSRLMYRYQWAQGGYAWFEQRNILHVEDVALHSDRSWVNVMQPLWQALLMLKTVKLGLAAEDYVMDFFNNGGRTGGILSLKSGSTKTTRDKVEEGFKQTYESGEAFKTMTLREDVAKFIPAQMSGTDAQLIEGRTFEASDVARWYRLPPHKLGLEGPSGYKGPDEEQRAYLSSTLQTHLCGIASEATFKLCLGGLRDGPLDHFCEHDTSTVMLMSPIEKAQAATIAAGGPIITVDEGREWIGNNPMGINRLRQPLNMGESDEEDDTPGTDKGTAPRALGEAVWPTLEQSIGQLRHRSDKTKSLEAFHLCVSKWAEKSRETIPEKIQLVCDLARVDPTQIADEFVRSIEESLADGVASGLEYRNVLNGTLGWHLEHYKESIGCEKPAK